mmetsp:Transcript_50828/g.95063  ORF Transcript_50828/g.95063 Transcript_50828/m.95063 type:complete len:184 (-) Transcript_50828:204-755(-)
MLSTHPSVMSSTGPSQSISAALGLHADAAWPGASMRLPMPPVSAPCAPPANPPPEIAGSEPNAPPSWDPQGAGEDTDDAKEPPRPLGILLSISEEDKQRRAVVEKAKAQGIPLKVRLPDAALSVVRPLMPGCPAKKRLPWPDVMEDEAKTSKRGSPPYYPLRPAEAEVPSTFRVSNVPFVAAR